MSQIVKEFKVLAEEAKEFTEQFLSLPPETCILLKPFSAGYFVHKLVPSVTLPDGVTVVFNEDWVRSSLTSHHDDDIQFFLFHELRHVYQRAQISKWKNNILYEETEEVVSNWEREFRNYQTNYGDPKSQMRNFAQEIEQDANGYALALLNMKNLRAVDWSFEHSLPMDAYHAADIRSRQYYKTKPELKRQIDKRYREINGKRNINERPGRNEPCPCGSGKKFKKCCIGKDIYD